MTAPPRYHHVCVLVPDMDDAIAWFRDALGVTVHSPRRMVTQGRIDQGEFGDEEQHQGISYIAWSAEGPPYYEVIEGKDASHGTGLHALEKHGKGLHHVGMFVPDVDAQVQRLAAQGVRLQARIVGENGRTIVCWTEPAPSTGLAVEYIDESLYPSTQRWIETGEPPQVAGVASAAHD